MSERLAAILVSSVLLVACSGAGFDREDVLAYARAVKPLAKEGGRVVQTGIKPGIGELQRAEISLDVFRERAATWRRQMTTVRADFAAVAAPGRLAEVKKLFDESLSGYIEAIDGFVAASARPKAEVADAISRVIPVAERADKTYDRAVAALKTMLADAGLDPAEAP